MKVDLLVRRCEFKKQSTDRQQFRRELIQMVKEDNRSQITFNQLISVLGKHNMKFYSPQQFKKMSKLFSNVFQSLPLKQPFQHLDLHSKQYISKDQFVLLVKVLNKKQQIAVKNKSQPHLLHSVDKCMRDFVILMKRRYGSQTNWFKVVGGMTVSISIETFIFEQNLRQIMRNTCHSRCIGRMMEIFADVNQKSITWERFISIVKIQIRKISHYLKEKNKSELSVNKSQQQDISINNYQTVKSSFSKTIKSSITQNFKSFGIRNSSNQKSIDFDNHNPTFFRSRCRTEGPQQKRLYLQWKKCKIYERLKTSISFQANHDAQNKLSVSSIENYSRLDFNSASRHKTQRIWKKHLKDSQKSQTNYL